MQLLSYAFSAALLFAGCSKNKAHQSITACGIENPTENISWLKKKIDDIRAKKQQATVTLVRYEGQDYINVQLVYMACYLCYVTTCDGIPLHESGDSVLRHNIIFSSKTEVQTLLTIGY